MGDKVLIEVKNINKTFDGNLVLDNISLNIKDGEFLTLLGPSGCGKTTLMRILAGFETPDSGEIIMDNKNIVNKTPVDREFNMVFQNYALFPHMSVYENIAFGLQMKNKPKDYIDAEVIKMLKTFKLEKFRTRKPKELSGGQQQRVAISRAIINKPKVLLLDECLSALDYKLRKDMQLELKELQQKLGITFIFVTHDQEEALTMSDRIIVMHDGIIEQEGTPDEIYEYPANLFVANFIGEINELEGQVKQVTKEHLVIDIGGHECFFKKELERFYEKDGVKIIIRPEDLKIRKLDYENKKLEGVVKNLMYKGKTIDIIVELSNGKQLVATEFYNWSKPEINFEIDEKIAVSWSEDSEVIFHESK